MSGPSIKRHQFFDSIYHALMSAYPADFRREYGAQMSQLLRDCERNATTRLELIAVWARTLLDLAQSAPVEHLQNLRKENHFMSKLRNDLIAVLGCLLIIAIAAVLLSYGRNHQIGPILVFAYALDAIVGTGIAGNVAVFLLVKLTNRNPVRIAFWTFLLVHALPAIALTLVVSRFDPTINAANILVGYVVSFGFWYGLHWLWAQRNKSLATA